MGIHPTALVDEASHIGPDVQVGAYTVIHANVRVGAGTQIGAFCELGVPTPLGDGSPLEIEQNSWIRSHSVFYESVRFGPNLVTGHSVVVREHTVGGTGVQIGSFGDVQGRCSLGNHVRFQSKVFVAQGTRIEDCVWVFPSVVIANDPTPPSDTVLGVHLGPYAAIGANSTLLPGISVGEGALVAAASTVTRDVGAHRIVRGNPATDQGETETVKLRDGSGRQAYPWTRHFHRGYPEELVSQWLSEIGKT